MKKRLLHARSVSSETAASLDEGLTATLRANSTIWTGGAGNLFIATAEMVGALLVSFLALAAPAVAIALVILFLWLAIRLLRRLLGGMRAHQQTKNNR